MRELWDVVLPVTSACLPRSIDTIVQKLPPGTGITTDKLIWEHTVYPYVRISLPEARAKELYGMMCGQVALSAGTEQKAGMSGRIVPGPQYLRYCPLCVQDDIRCYGETYWHRTHQLPGVLICPEHGGPVVNSVISLQMIRWSFYPASQELCGDIRDSRSYSDNIEEKLITLAKDTVWLLEHGQMLEFKDNMVEKYHSILQTKKLMNAGGRIDHQILHEELDSFFGKDFLKLIHSDGEDTHLHWSSKIIKKAAKIVQPLHHLLMMRFLSGSPQEFLETEGLWEPYGKAPWPCHNKICPHYLEDVIADIKIDYGNGFHKADFICPYCGFSYHRRKAVPKEEQYAEPVMTTSYGFLWNKMLEECLINKWLTITETSRILKCTKGTVYKYAAKYQFIPASKAPKKYVPPPKPRKKAETRESRRHKLMNLICENPGISRDELRRLNSKDYEWLRTNDTKWFGAIAPPKIEHRIDWVKRDEDYLKKLLTVIPDMIGNTDSLCPISVYSLCNAAGIDKSKIYCDKDKLPKTIAFLEKHIETKDEWRRRKIIWAINKLKEQGKALSITGISRFCTISSKMFAKHRDFILDCIEREQMNRPI